MRFKIKSIYKIILLIIILFALNIFLYACQKDVQRNYSDSFFAMDTVMNVDVYDSDKAEEAVNEIKQMIFSIERNLTQKDENSILSMLNKKKSVVVDIDTLNMIKAAIKYSDETNGSLDISTYPASKAWGFGTPNLHIPSKDELEKLKKCIDYKKIKIDGSKINLPSNMQIWLGAVAKGYCTTKALEILKKYKVKSALINLGGNIACIGEPPDSKFWRIGIEDPKNIGQAIGVLKTQNKAVVSSGNYQRFFEKYGKIYHHIIDPKTAAPAKVSINMITIICDDATKADCLSTGLYVMGKDATIEFWHKHNKEFDFIMVSDNEIIYSSNLKDDFSTNSNMKLKPID